MKSVVIIILLCVLHSESFSFYKEINSRYLSISTATQSFLTLMHKHNIILTRKECTYHFVGAQYKFK